MLLPGSGSQQLLPIQGRLLDSHFFSSAIQAAVGRGDNLVRGIICRPQVSVRIWRYRGAETSIFLKRNMEGKGAFDIVLYSITA